MLIIAAIHSSLMVRSVEISMPVFPRFGVSRSHKAAEHLANVQTCVFDSLTIEFIRLIWYPSTTTIGKGRRSG
jgi:hypothetical protein